MPILGIWFFSLPLLVFGQSDHSFYLPYQLDAPIRQLTLDKELDEISGLSMSNNEEYLVAVQDEEGSFFYLDKETGETIKKISFWKDGDYEGVELVGEDLYVVKSSGTLYQIKNIGKEDQSVAKYNDFLTSENNIEGLTYWPQENKLLLACKAKSGEEIDETQKKAIYAFDIDSKSFDSIPFLTVERSMITRYLEHCQAGPNHEKICDLFNAANDEFELTPAAIAIHPITEQIYVLSSRANLLLIINMAGEVLHITKLPKSFHRQPEGICFDKKGNMYISNERRKEHDANIIFYEFVAE